MAEKVNLSPHAPSAPVAPSAPCSYQSLHPPSTTHPLILPEAQILHPLFSSVRYLTVTLPHTPLHCAMLRIFKRKRKRKSKPQPEPQPEILHPSPKISYDSSSFETLSIASSTDDDDNPDSTPNHDTSSNSPPFSPPQQSLTTLLLPHIRNLHQTQPTLHELRHRLCPVTPWRYYHGSNKGITDDLFLTDYNLKRSEVRR